MNEPIQAPYVLTAHSPEQRLKDFDDNPVEWANRAFNQDEPLAATLRHGTTEPKSGHLDNLVHQYLSDNSLYVLSSGPYQSSKLDAFDSKGKMVALHAVMQDTFDYHMLVSDPPNNNFNNINEVSTIAPNDPTRPWMTAMLRQKAMIRLPDMGINETFARTQTQAEDLGRVPFYNVPTAEELMKDLGETGKPEESELTFTTETYDTRRVGRALKTSRKWRGNSLRAEGIALWVAKVGVRYQIGVRNLGIQMIADGLTSTQQVDHSALGLDRDLIDAMAWHFSPNQEAYMTDALVADKTTLLNLRKAARTPLGGDSSVIVLPQTPQTTILNPLSPNGSAAIVEANSFNSDTSNKTLVWDSMSTAVLVLLAGVPTDESHYEPGAQIDIRYLVREFGMYIEVSEGRVLFTIASS